MRTPLIAGIAAIALTLGSIGAAQAYDKKDESRRGYHMMERMTEELGLDEQQAAALRDTMKSNFSEMREQKQGYRDTHRKLMQLNPGDSDYQAKLDALVAQAQDATKERILMRAEHHKEVLELLTPEQRDKFTELNNDRKFFLKGGHGKHHGHSKCD